MGPVNLQYDLFKSPVYQDEWHVEAVNYDGDGEVYVTVFAGPDAKARAEEYAEWKNRGTNAAS